MSTRFVRITLLATLACLAIGCNKDQSSNQPVAVATASPSTPDAAVKGTLQNLRNNNVSGLLESMLPPVELSKLKTNWSSEINKEPVTEEDRKKFSETISKLTAADAESKLYAEAEPQLKELDQQMAQQMPMMIAMGQGFVQSAIQQSKELNDQQKQQANAALDATAKWAGTVKFTDPALVKQAISVVCKTARELNLKTLDEARALNYDQAMQKAGIVLGGVKKVLEIYGFFLDKTLDSAKVELVSSEGDNAKVKVSYNLFDTPLSSESELVKLDGKWFGKQVINEWNKQQHPNTTPAAAAAGSDTKTEDDSNS